MSKSLFKNIIIFGLMGLSIFLTIRLWFGVAYIPGLFPDSPVVVAADPAGQRNADMVIESASIMVAAGGRVHQNIHGNISEQLAWNIASYAIAALIENGTYEQTHRSSDFIFDLGSENLMVINYNFSMPTTFFREFFGQRAGFLSSVFGSFEELAMAPTRHGEITFSFNDQTTGSFHAFTLQDQEIFYKFTNFFADVMESDPYVPSTFPVADINPIGDLRLATAEPFVSFFFPATPRSSTVNNIFTYHDNFRVVKFYPNNVVEYNSLVGRNVGSTNFITSFLAVLDMIDQDQNNMIDNGAPMNDIFFVGYYYDASNSRWSFYFDYVVDGMVLDLTRDFYPLVHAIEVQTANNTVERYRRLMLNFIREDIADEY